MPHGLKCHPNLPGFLPRGHTRTAVKSSILVNNFSAIRTVVSPSWPGLLCYPNPDSCHPDLSHTYIVRGIIHACVWTAFWRKRMKVCKTFIPFCSVFHFSSAPSLPFLSVRFICLLLDCVLTYNQSSHYGKSAEGQFTALGRSYLPSGKMEDADPCSWLVVM